MPVALNIEGEFFAAVIAAQSMGWPKLRLGAANMRKSMGAHHKPPRRANFAIFAAILRASSFVSNLAADRR